MTEEEKVKEPISPWHGLDDIRWEITKALRMPQIVEWLSKRIKKKHVDFAAGLFWGQVIGYVAICAFLFTQYLLKAGGQ